MCSKLCPLATWTRNAATVVSIVMFVFWCSFVAGFGIVVLQEDIHGQAFVCNKTYHLFKHEIVNVAFMLAVVSSYFLWKGGGEGARARALLILILHFALATWGSFLWHDMDGACIAALEAYGRVVEFLRVCVVHNLAFFMLYIFHEAYLGEAMQADYTLFVEIIGCGKSEYPYYTTPENGAPLAFKYEASSDPTGVSGIFSPVAPPPDPPPHSPPHLSNSSGKGMR